MNMKNISKNKKIFNKMFSSCQEYLNLNIFNIWYNFNKDSNTVMASIDIDLSHLSCVISYAPAVKNFINKKEIDKLILLTIHEMCHIITGWWTCYLEYDKNIFLENMWDIQYSMIYNHILRNEEQMTNILDNVIFKGFKKTKEYKDIISLFKWD